LIFVQELLFSSCRHLLELSLLRELLVTLPLLLLLLQELPLIQLPLSSHPREQLLLLLRLQKQPLRRQQRPLQLFDFLQEFSLPQRQLLLLPEEPFVLLQRLRLLL